ncbi:hypothetical protein V2S66_18650 [Streptomyces sp. V4-01]|uniref:Uncharacterized protein n=1 Tax=Actinacidiphila polyblastidii TaxID=3110430 RepID=A0ABU7PFY2_9ACTN|nr:hypothetical protein [Streptomyces sp. V4-01]
MKTCHRFDLLKAHGERDIRMHKAHAAKHAGEPSAKQSATMAALARQGMGRALSRHYANCPECA